MLILGCKLHFKGLITKLHCFVANSKIDWFTPFFGKKMRLSCAIIHAVCMSGVLLLRGEQLFSLENQNNAHDSPALSLAA